MLTLSLFQTVLTNCLYILSHSLSLTYCLSHSMLTHYLSDFFLSPTLTQIEAFLLKTLKFIFECSAFQSKASRSLFQLKMELSKKILKQNGAKKSFFASLLNQFLQRFGEQTFWSYNNDTKHRLEAQRSQYRYLYRESMLQLLALDKISKMGSRKASCDGLANQAYPPGLIYWADTVV